MTVDLEQPRAIEGLQARLATRFRVLLHGGIWQVTKDGRFYGHYRAAQPAFDAARAAALGVVASGGSADVVWNDRRPDGATTDRAKGLAVTPFGTVRTMQFRAGTTRIVP